MPRYYATPGVNLNGLSLTAGVSGLSVFLTGPVYFLPDEMAASFGGMLTSKPPAAGENYATHKLGSDTRLGNWIL